MNGHSYLCFQFFWIVYFSIAPSIFSNVYTYYSEIEDACEKSKSKTLVDKDYCHTYYDCSVLINLKSCPYPKLFSEDTNSCEDFKKVKCGSRREFKNYCTYLRLIFLIHMLRKYWRNQKGAIRNRKSKKDIFLKCIWLKERWTKGQTMVYKYYTENNRLSNTNRIQNRG